jgi:16S rRNA (guanine966-N2)-methyltransferase
MRIISGLWRGQPLRAPKGIRPTTDRIREAIFSILGDAAGMKVVDLYAGSGALGIEALSRGAEAVSFVDISKRTLAVVASNLAGKENIKYELIRQNSLAFLKNTEDCFDWIFCDPPYEKVDFRALLEAFSNSRVVGKESLIILETDRFRQFELPSDLISIDQRKFGDTLVHFIRRESSINGEPHRA